MLLEGPSLGGWLWDTLLSEDRGHILADRTRDSVCFEKIVEIIALCIPQRPSVKLTSTQRDFVGALCCSPPHCPPGTASSLPPFT